MPIPEGPRLDVGGGEGTYKALIGDGRGPAFVVDHFVSPGVNVVADAHHLPLRSDVAGLVVLVEVLEHLQEPQRALDECYRVLRRGGVLGITTPQYWHVHGYPSDYYRYTDAGLRWLCQRAGFTVLDCWSRGGPILILFHVIRVNLSVRWQPLFVIPFYRLAEWLDAVTYEPRPRGRHYDALGWTLLAQKV